VKEAEKQILGFKNKEAQEAKQSETQLMKLNQTQIENLERQRSDLEKRFPGIANSVPTGLSQQEQLDLATTRARRTEIFNARTRLAGIEARSEAIKSHLRDVQAQAQKIAKIEPQIVELERTKELAETNYRYFQSSLEKARVDEALDPSKMPNISVVQSPSVAFKTSRELKKLVLGLAGGGVALGLGFAFLIEFLLNRSVRRPLELETLLGIPPMLSIPYLNGRHPLRLRWPTSRQSLRGNGHSASWESDHFIRPYSDAIRDRLVLYFQLNRMTHKPKLVAVTDCSRGAGASTLAGGLAAALSETGDGKVLLVDMNVGHPEAHPFFRGTPACSLTEALVGAPAPAGDNLYLAVATPPDAPQTQIIPRKFYDLVPHLKASDFDYIIFDMPTLGQTSITPAMAGLMDKLLIVVEAEKSNRDFLKRAYAELLACRANASLILNKVRSYTPKCLGAEV
jgi:Mrp family chromosome partitioning ATPase